MTLETRNGIIVGPVVADLPTDVSQLRTASSAHDSAIGVRLHAAAGGILTAAEPRLPNPSGNRPYQAPVV